MEHNKLDNVKFPPPESTAYFTVSLESCRFRMDLQILHRLRNMKTIVKVNVDRRATVTISLKAHLNIASDTVNTLMAATLPDGCCVPRHTTEFVQFDWI